MAYEKLIRHRISVERGEWNIQHCKWSGVPQCKGSAATKAAQEARAKKASLPVEYMVEDEIRNITTTGTSSSLQGKDVNRLKNLH